MEDVGSGAHLTSKSEGTLMDWKDLFNHTNRKDSIPHAPLFTHRNRAELCVPLDGCPSQYSLVISSPTNGERGKGGANCFPFFSFDPSQRQQWQNSYPESTRGKPNILKADDNRVSVYCYCLCSFGVTGAPSSSGNGRPVWNRGWDTFLSGQMKVTVLYQAAVMITGHTCYVLTTRQALHGWWNGGEGLLLIIYY